MEPLVSILIPAYNAEPWIRKSIESALRQTWRRKEIIVVDDGSCDNTVRVARAFESQGVRVITQDNRGPCAARNKALAYATGEYIQWLDADDLLASDKIAKQLSTVRSKNRSRVLLSCPTGTFYLKPEQARFVPNPLWRDMDPIEWIVTKFRDDCWVGIHSWLVPRELTQQAGPWDERLNADVDGEYFCRVAARAEKIKFVSDAKCYYRLGNLHSISTKKLRAKSESLTIKLYVRHLLELENSERTIAACNKLVNDWIDLYYWLDETVLDMGREIASEFGGYVWDRKKPFMHLLIKRPLGRKIVLGSKRVKYNLRVSWWKLKEAYLSR